MNAVLTSAAGMDVLLLRDRRAEYLAVSWIDGQRMLWRGATQAAPLPAEHAAQVVGALDCECSPDALVEFWAAFTGRPTWWDMAELPRPDEMLEELRDAARRGSIVLLQIRDLEQRGAGGHVERAPAGGAYLPDDSPRPETYDLELERLYHDDRPVRRAPFEVVLADGQRVKGTLDDDGRAKLRKMPARPSAVSFGPDARAYTPVSPPTNPEYRETLSSADIDAIIGRSRSAGS